MKCKKLLATLFFIHTLFSCKPVAETDKESQANFNTSNNPSIKQRTLYSKYLFTRGTTEVETAVKIEIGKDGIPKYLYVKDLRPKEADEPVDKIALQPGEPVARISGAPRVWVGYLGDSTQTQDGQYTVKYPKSAQEIARMIEKDQMPTLYFYPPRRGDNKFVGNATRKLTQKQWEELAKDSDSTSEGKLERYFKEKCVDNAGLKLTAFPMRGRNPIVHGREYSRARVYLYKDENIRCRHFLYGLGDIAVMKYLKECQARCISNFYKAGIKNKYGYTTSSFAFLFKNHDFFLECEDSEDQYGFYMKNGLLHMSEMEDRRQRTVSFNCHTGDFREI